MLLLILTPEAEKDVLEAYRWYEEQCAGLGEEFLLCIDAVMHSMARDPQIYQLVHKNIRRSVLRRFPYCVFFIETPNEIRVLAIFHAHRKPSVWKKRNINPKN